MGFIKALLIILLCYYGFKLAVRYLFPFLLYKAAKKVEKKFQEQQQHYGQQNSSTESAEPMGRKEEFKSTKVVGEYIEFEEIDEK